MEEGNYMNEHNFDGGFSYCIYQNDHFIFDYLNNFTKFYYWSSFRGFDIPKLQNPLNMKKLELNVV